MKQPRLRHQLEGWGLRILVWGFAHLPPAKASRLGGTVARHLGPHLASSRIAHINLKLAFPKFSSKKRAAIVRACWENLGQTFAEFPHLATLPPMPDAKSAGWRIEGAEHLIAARESGRPVVFFSGHLGNWELLPALVARYDLAFAPFYRAPNNPEADKILRTLRQKTSGTQPMFPKGARGARQALRHLAEGKHLGVLGDQKMNDGICSQLFGMPAMTAPATAALALRFNALIITGHVWREGPAQLVLKVDSPFEAAKFQQEDRQKAIANLTLHLNKRLEGWIKQRPGNWLWLHRRWDKALYKKRA